MKVALVYDRVTTWGGAERVLLALHKIWPDAPLYTSVYDQVNAPWAHVFDVRPSFLQKVPFARHNHELLACVTPIAFETFSFDQFDVVISVTSAEAKSIITKPTTLHICYCLTPTRYLWSGYEQYIKKSILGNLLKFCAPVLRRWDKISSTRPDLYVAISARVAERITQYYHTKVAEIIYPPVDASAFTIQKSSDYFLIVSRLVSYKRIELIIDVFNTLGYPLVIIGNGRDRKKLQQRASKNITFIDKHLTDSELVRYYEHSRAFVYAADEDFGIAAVEAQLCGKPVIAYRQSGVSETVIDGKTGVFFDMQTKEAMLDAMKRFEKFSFNPDIIRSHALRFDSDIFEQRIKTFVDKYWNKKL